MDEASRLQLWSRIFGTVRCLDTRNYYQLLGVSPDVSPEVLRLAFYASVAPLQPALHARESDSERREAIMLLNARLREAYNTLASPELRKAYDEGLRRGELRLASPAEQKLNRAARGSQPPARDQARAFPRAPFAATVQIRCAKWADFLTLHADNISRGGLFVGSHAPLDVGTQIRLRVMLPHHRTLDLDAEVVRIVEGDPPGMGLRFMELDAARQAIVDRLVAEAQGQRSTSRPVVRAAGSVRLPARPLLEDELFSQPMDLPQGTSVERLSREELAAEARAALVAGRYGEAREKFAGAIEVEKEDTTLRAAFHLAAAYEAKQAGRIELAHEHFERVLQYDQRCEEAIVELRHH
jgi:uncharacterized protein (TIGR02266 family)